jgi:hypothetical protein
LLEGRRVLISRQDICPFAASACHVLDYFFMQG